MTAVPVLRYYDATQSVAILSDASQNGLRCCLLQEGQPLAYASRALPQSEQNFAQIEKKESLSIGFAWQRFHYYLYGEGDITEETDNKPLIAIFNKPLLSTSMRLQSMLLTLQKYSLKVVYRPSSQMHISDTLSRATAPPRPADVQYTPHCVCSLLKAQEDLENIDPTDYL